LPIGASASQCGDVNEYALRPCEAERDAPHALSVKLSRRGNDTIDRQDEIPSSTTPPLVVAIVLNWNNLSDTLECVESLRRSDYSNLLVWVVDNNSDEDPTLELKSKYPDVRVLRTTRNLGYAGGNNTGVRTAIDCGAAYILLLNNDAVVAPDCVRRLVAAAQANRQIGMATPTVFHYDRRNEVYWDGGFVDWRSGDVRHDSSSLPVEGGIIRSEWLNGCSLLVRVSAIRDIGLLDERYFLYFEDADWSVRAARRGWTNAVVSEARAWHKVNVSTGGFANPVMRFYFFRNRYLFSATHCLFPGRLRWKFRYFWGMWCAYVRERHERENRRVFLSVLASLLSGSTGAYAGSSSPQSFIHGLDAILTWVLNIGSVVKRLLPGTKKARS
jgi:GT2 family glycosyltransferase